LAVVAAIVYAAVEVAALGNADVAAARFFDPCFAVVDDAKFVIHEQSSAGQRPPAPRRPDALLRASTVGSRCRRRRRQRCLRRHRGQRQRRPEAAAAVAIAIVLSLPPALVGQRQAQDDEGLPQRRPVPAAAPGAVPRRRLAGSSPGFRGRVGAA
jgi:hypothetical protein